MLTALPESIGQLQNLSALNLSANMLAFLPESLGQLQNLSKPLPRTKRAEGDPQLARRSAEPGGIDSHSELAQGTADWLDGSESRSSGSVLEQPYSCS